MNALAADDTVCWAARQGEYSAVMDSS